MLCFLICLRTTVPGTSAEGKFVAVSTGGWGYEHQQEKAGNARVISNVRCN